MALRLVPDAAGTKHEIQDGTTVTDSYSLWFVCDFDEIVIWNSEID